MAGNVVHQGVVALISPIEHIALDKLIFNFNSDKNPGFLIVVDRIQDPHNMGAIIRSAEIFNAKGMIYAKRENVPITETVIKASAGAVFHIPICQTGNLAQTIDELRKNDIWIFGSSLTAKSKIWDLDFGKKCGIIIGNEEKGIRPLISKKCDEQFSIPHSGKTQSLNASVAAGIIFAEIYRQNYIKSIQS
jgi:23S rRNA (guanosine2251-2'-O)-methyltransferase